MYLGLTLREAEIQGALRRWQRMFTLANGRTCTHRLFYLRRRAY